MAYGNLFGDIKSRLGLGSQPAVDEEQDYAEYDDYEQDYDEYESTDDRYSSRYKSSMSERYDPYMERGRVTTRGGRDNTDFPRLVTMDDARQSALSLSSRSTATSRTSTVRSYGRTMVDSSLPPSMTAEGSAAVADASNRRAHGLAALFGDSTSFETAPIPAVTAPSTAKKSTDILRDSMNMSMPGSRQLQVIRPSKYEDAEGVTDVLKSGDVAIIVFKNTDRDLMKRILDFSFGAASALDAGVESVSSGVFAICRNSGLSDSEKNELRRQGIA